MPPRTKARKPNGPPKDGPVKPGSVLHRALEMVARAVAKTFGEKSSRRKKSEPGP